MKRYRKLKVQRVWQSRRYNYIKVPNLTLEGKWLAEKGFDIGTNVEVELQKNKLIITLRESNP